MEIKFVKDVFLVGVILASFLIFSPARAEIQKIFDLENEGIEFFIDNDEDGLFYKDGIVVMESGGFVKISKDGKKTAILIKKDGEFYLDVNGQRSGAYGWISDIVFSPDSKQIAFKAIKGELFKDTKEARSYVVLNNKENGPYGFVDSDLIFSPDSKQFVYAVRDDNGRHYLIRNGKKINDDITSQPIFSPDSKQLAYTVSDLKGPYLVVNGKKSKTFSVDGDLVFSPDSKKLAYVTTSRNQDGRYIKDYIVINGKKTKSLGGGRVENLIFSPDSKQYVYTTRDSYIVVDNKPEPYVVKNGKKSETYGNIKNLIFSPNSKQFAYVIYENFKYRAVINGKKSEAYVNFSGPVFSPDSKQVAYAAGGKGGDDRKTYLVVNGKEIGVFDGASVPLFSPNSKHMAYLIYEENKAINDNDADGEGDQNSSAFLPSRDSSTLILDGKRVGYNLVGGGDGFTPDSKQFVYAFQNPNDKAIYINRINLD